MKKNTLITAALAAAALATAGAAWSEQYKDYTPRKGGWQITEVHVDSNHIDDYLTGLRTSWQSAQEILKKRGIIDQYGLFVRMGAAGGGANVLLTQHYPTWATMDADKARDTSVEAEMLAALPKEKGEAMVAGYEKYRTFVGDGFWTQIDLAK